MKYNVFDIGEYNEVNDGGFDVYKRVCKTFREKGV